VYVDEENDYREILGYLRSLSPDLCQRVVYYKENESLFDKFDIEKDLERLLKRKVWLKSGGYILIDRTEALVAIDVNTVVISERPILRTQFSELILMLFPKSAASCVCGISGVDCC
jgi:Rne/Rng family ribonuclease